MLAEARRRHPTLSLVQADAHALPIRSQAVDLAVFITTLEFLERPAAALAEAVRVSRRGVLVVALNRWSAGGLSRRWGADARTPRLGRANDFTPTSLRALASAAAVFRALESAFTRAASTGHVVMTITASNACPVGS